MFNTLSNNWQFVILVLSAVVSAFTFVFADIVALKRRRAEAQPEYYKNDPRQFIRVNYILALISCPLSFIILFGVDIGPSYNLIFSIYLGASLPGLLARGTSSLSGIAKIGNKSFE